MEKVQELSEKDEKITTMKKRMAETIGKNSTYSISSYLFFTWKYDT